jgi:hypothetical protein
MFDSFWRIQEVEQTRYPLGALRSQAICCPRVAVVERQCRKAARLIWAMLKQGKPAEISTAAR